MNEAERQQFEKWARDEFEFTGPFRKWPSGNYVNPTFQARWEAWQAARASESSPPQPERVWHMYVWTRLPSFHAVAQATSVAEARELLLEEIGGGDGSCPEREAAAKWVREQQPSIYYRSNAEFSLTDSAELRETEAYTETLQKQIKELRAAATTPSAPPTKGTGMTPEEIKQAQEVIDSVMNDTGALGPLKAVFPSEPMKILAELRAARTAFHENFGVPVSHPYARFLQAVGALEDLVQSRTPALKNASGGESPLSEQKTDGSASSGADLSAPPLSNEPLAATDWMRQAAQNVAKEIQRRNRNRGFILRAIKNGQGADVMTSGEMEWIILQELAKHAGEHVAIDLRREADSRWLAEVPSIPGCMAYGRTQSEAVIKVGKLLEQIEAEKKENI